MTRADVTEALTARALTLARMEETGTIVRGCAQCQEIYTATDPRNVCAPSHTASQRCESGRREHCTCDTCF